MPRPLPLLAKRRLNILGGFRGRVNNEFRLRNVSTIGQIMLEMKLNRCGSFFDDRQQNKTAFRLNKSNY